MVCPSGERSSDSHVASDVVKASDRSVMSGNPLFFTASAAALSFCARLCASGAYVVMTRIASRHSERQANRGMDTSWREGGDYTATVRPIVLARGVIQVYDRRAMVRVTRAIAALLTFL